MTKQACAIVVTYNRRELLQECLSALLAQQQPVDGILVVNNASTDGTKEMLESEFAQVQVLHLLKNIGGAGGFHMGLEWAYLEGYEWIWLMDDDTITKPDSLTELFAAHERFGGNCVPRLLASKVVWTDQTLHPMNIPMIKKREIEWSIRAAEKRTVSLRTASFVSLLLHRTLVQQYGLPYADYFIWNDDSEYTARILRHEFGVLVPDSVVEHKTSKKHSPTSEAGPRFYYEARNKIWILTRSNAFTKVEKAILTYVLCVSAWEYLQQSRYSLASLRVLAAGLKDGIIRKPTHDTKANLAVPVAAKERRAV